MQWGGVRCGRVPKCDNNSQKCLLTTGSLQSECEGYSFNTGCKRSIYAILKLARATGVGTISYTWLEQLELARSAGVSKSDLSCQGWKNWLEQLYSATAAIFG